jgi:hypothetical protein
MERKEYIQGKLFSEPERTKAKGYAHTYPRPEFHIENLQQVIRKLRKQDLDSGYCFMIFDEHLEEDEAFYEYPDGRIRIEKLNPRNIEIPRIVIKVLNRKEVRALRERHVIIR